jgi:translation initiation factor IF-2
MAKIRIHELAKKLNMNSKDLVARLRQMGYSVKNHMSTIDEKEIAKIKKNLKSNDNKNMKDNKTKQMRFNLLFSTTKGRPVPNIDDR